MPIRQDCGGRRNLIIGLDSYGRDRFKDNANRGVVAIVSTTGFSRIGKCPLLDVERRAAGKGDFVCIL